MGLCGSGEGAGEGVGDGGVMTGSAWFDLPNPVIEFEFCNLQSWSE